ncbi:MAG: dUTP diphosphatase [bacterium]|nr:dUTP diphosphatase [bacterium]
MLSVTITRIDTSLPLPTYQTEGAVAFDLAPRVDATIAPGAVAYVPANLIVAVPAGYALLIAGRSSLHKKGLVLANQLGIVDEDYCGPDDELLLALRNITDQPVMVERGQRLAQGFFTPTSRAVWIEIAQKDVIAKTRGGWGSTGA